MEQAPQYRLRQRSVDPLETGEIHHRSTAFEPQRSRRTDLRSDESIPLFLSDSDGEPDPSEYASPRRHENRLASISSKALVFACAAAAAAILVALFSSDAARDGIVNIKASMAASTQPTVAPSGSPAARNPQNSTGRSIAADASTAGSPGASMTVATAPAREEIKLAYQNALQARAGRPEVAVATPASQNPPEPAVHQLDADAIASLLKRADALKASGDVAAARLVLRRVADAGDANGAMLLAETYDPEFLKKLGVHGVVPDPATARNWYEKARLLGASEAPRRLEMLASRQQ